MSIENADRLAIKPVGTSELLNVWFDVFDVSGKTLPIQRGISSMEQAMEVAKTYLNTCGDINTEISIVSVETKIRVVRHVCL